LGAALADLDGRLAESGVRIDHDPTVTGVVPLRGLRARDRYLTQGQRAALHRLDDPVLDVDTARVLDAIAHAPGVLTERTRSLDPAAIVALQQRGLVRRHPGGGYLELTEDVQYVWNDGRTTVVRRHENDSAADSS